MVITLEHRVISLIDLKKACLAYICIRPNKVTILHVIAPPFLHYYSTFIYHSMP